MREVLDAYLRRIRRYTKLEEVEVKDPAKLARAVGREGDVIALEVEGTSMKSAALAARFERNQNRSIRLATFVIGGADGLPPELSRDADLRLSLSAMTLPHRLARVVLAEQIYRAFTILRGEPYDH